MPDSSALPDSAPKDTASAGGSTAPVRLSTPIKDLSGVGPRRAQQFNRLEVATVSDLIKHLPARYEREFAEGTVADLPMEGLGSARGTVINCRWVQGGAGSGRFQATIQDHSDRIHLIWFNARYLVDKLKPGMLIRVQGKVKAFGGYPQMTNPKWEAIVEGTEPGTKNDRLKPIYPSTEGLSSDAIEKQVAAVLPLVLGQLVDPLPADSIRIHNMPPLAAAFRMAHGPAHEEEAASARRRLAFNELLLLQLGIAIKRHFNETSLSAPPLRWSAAIDEHIRARFPFALTAAQESVIKEIATDLQRDRPMNRLVQGDVGSGKTVVALYALLMAVAAREQGAMMAPTELLAEQHFQSISAMLAGSNVRLALLVGGQPAARRNALLKSIEAGELDIIVGTHALLTSTVKFKNLAVVVVDEQHRFGVMQRAALKSGKGDDYRKQKRVRAPHCLVMTATPIPRTLSLTVFGDLDISTITGLPPGRAPIITRVVPPQKADDVYRYMVERLAKGEQAYVVVPVIDATGSESATQLKNVRAHAKLLQDKFCRDYKVAAIHGQLERQSRERIMHRFRKGEVHVLVATTVIEVGVDVANASIMIVEHAERFGLSQLHQLRGRVGRGSDGRKSLCVFIAEPTTEEATKRMDAIGSTNDGFKIAEVDFEVRGMGDIFGTRQHGALPLRIARLPEHMDLLQLARRDAGNIINSDPHLAAKDHTLLRKVLLREYGETLGLVDVG